MCDVGGMVLAAGLSERMSGPLPKQLLPLGSQTVAAHTVVVAERSRLDRVVVVTGYRADEVAASVAGGRAVVVENPQYRSGNMSSFRAGAAALEDCGAVVVMLADMPGVTTEMIDRMVDEWHRLHPWAARSVYTDGQAHPLMFSADALLQACRMEGAKGVWRFLDAAPVGDVLPVRFAMPVPTDVNTQEEYERLLRARGES
jgi:molybdenum cofactor cytidylyltransferase